MLRHLTKKFIHALRNYGTEIAMANWSDQLKIGMLELTNFTGSAALLMVKR
jgi:hypothetical protein